MNTGDALDRADDAMRESGNLLEQADAVKRASNFKRRPRIVDGQPYPRPYVCLAVAAEYLGLNERTVKARIDLEQIEASVDGKVYRINLASLMAYKRRVEEHGYSLP